MCIWQSYRWTTNSWSFSRDKTSLNYASIMGLPITGQARVLDFDSDKLILTRCWKNYNLVSAAFYFGRSWTASGVLNIRTQALLGFLVFEFPTVYLSQKTRVAKYLGKLLIVKESDGTLSVQGANIVIWGIILMLHAVATSFGGFFALRFLLGAHHVVTAGNVL